VQVGRKVLEEAAAVAEDDRHEVDLELVDQDRREELLDGIRRRPRSNVLVAGRVLRELEGVLDALRART
jgi:hypothetical protein